MKPRDYGLTHNISYLVSQDDVVETDSGKKREVPNSCYSRSTGKC